MELSKTQQLIVDTMAKQSGSLGDTKVNVMSLNSLIGKGLVEEVDGTHVLTDEGWEASNIETPTIEMGQSDSKTPDDEPPVESPERSELWVELGQQMRVQVGVNKGRPVQVNIPAGTRCQVSGFDIEVTNRGKVTWYQVLTPKGMLENDAQVPFLIGIVNTPNANSAHRLFRYDYDDKVIPMQD